MASSPLARRGLTTNSCFLPPFLPQLMFPVIGGKDVVVWEEKPRKSEIDLSAQFTKPRQRKMELCTAARGAISRLPKNGLFTPNQTVLSWKTSLPLKHSSINHTNLGLQYYSNSPLELTTLEETSSGVSQYVKEETDGVTTVEDVQTIEKNESGETEGAKDEPSVDDKMLSFEFWNKLNIELDSESPYSVLLLGGGSLVALWLATAVVGAIDSIPVFPELMKVVGLAYSLWFSTRYLLFKKNRDELTAKIEEVKQQIVGSNDD